MADFINHAIDACMAAVRPSEQLFWQREFLDAATKLDAVPAAKPGQDPRHQDALQRAFVAAKGIVKTVTARHGENIKASDIAALLVASAIAKADMAAYKSAEDMAAMSARLDELEARVQELEANSKSGAISFRGVWKDDVDYERGAATTFQGGLWIALEDCGSVRPGTDPKFWQLAVKRGKAE